MPTAVTRFLRPEKEEAYIFGHSRRTDRGQTANTIVINFALKIFVSVDTIVSRRGYGDNFSVVTNLFVARTRLPRSCAYRRKREASDN